MKKIFLFLIVFLLAVSISKADTCTYSCGHGVTIDGTNFDCGEQDDICVNIVLGDDNYCETEYLEDCGCTDPDCVSAPTKLADDEACTLSTECQSGYCIGPNWHCGSSDKICYFNVPLTWLYEGQSTATSPFTGGQNICWSQCIKETCTQSNNYPQCNIDKDYCIKHSTTNLECRNDENGDNTWQLLCSSQTTCNPIDGKCKPTVISTDDTEPPLTNAEVTNVIIPQGGYPPEYTILLTCTDSSGCKNITYCKTNIQINLQINQMEDCTPETFDYSSSYARSRSFSCNIDDNCFLYYFSTDKKGNSEQLKYLEFGLVTDTDSDGLSDVEELTTGKDGYITYPNDADSDDDGFSDGEEFTAGSNPRDETSTPETVLCDLSSAEAIWTDADGKEFTSQQLTTGVSAGTQVGLCLTNTVGCINKDVSFVIFETDGAFGKSSEGITQSIASKISDKNIACTLWIAQYIDDLNGDPEFIFDTTIDNQIIPNSGELTVTEAPITPTGCTPSWSCGSWSACSITGTQTRTCNDLNNCETTLNKPAESQTCTQPTQPICTPGNCNNNKYCNADGLSETDCSSDPTKNGCCLTNLGCKAENTFLSLSGKKCYNKDWVTAACETDENCNFDESCQNTDQGYKCVNLCIDASKCCFCYTRCLKEVKQEFPDWNCKPHQQLLLGACD